MNRKIAVVILDGFGISDKQEGNAISMANPKFYNSLLKKYPNTSLEASQGFVGLPKGQPGNSEVGHLIIGSGRVLKTSLTLVNQNINNKNIFKNKIINDSIDEVLKYNKKLHLVGLVSDAGMHSHINHLFQLIDICKEKKVSPILHLFLDGRDTKKSGLDFIKEIDEKYCANDLAFIGTISGRSFAMDRNENWDMTSKVVLSMIKTKTSNISPIEYIEENYKRKVYDEFIEPISFLNEENILFENDNIIYFNFRTDRMRQLAHILSNSNNFSYKMNLPKFNNISIVDYGIDKIKKIIFPTKKVKNTLGYVLSQNNIRQLRVAETEKAAHITYYFDGFNEITNKLILKKIIKSDNSIPLIDNPEMKSKEITDTIIENIDNFDLAIVNYANPDMLGHTGNINSTIKSINLIDKQLEILYNNIVIKFNGVMFILSDHGNAENMLNNNKRHSINKVPFIITDNNIILSDNGTIANVAPTILEYSNIKIPTQMSKSLLIKKV